jgi:cation diffusion facilitator family transporter
MEAAKVTEQGGSRRVVLVALAGNLAIAVAKFTTFAFTGSTAILTEGVHSLVDTSDQVLMLLGQSRAERAADASHPFGYGMEIYFWSFVVALMIFLAGGAVGIWEGAEKVLHPTPVKHPLAILGVVAISGLFEGLSFRTAYRAYRRMVRGRDIRLWRFLKISKDPNLFTTLLEDGTALTGLAIAALGVVGSAYLGALWADGAASIVIGLLLMAIAVFLANETRSLIAGEAAAPPIVEIAEATLRSCGDLGELVRLKTLHLGPNMILATVAWRFPAAMSRQEVEAASRSLVLRLRASDSRIGTVLFEPAEAQPGSGDGRAT